MKSAPEETPERLAPEGEMTNKEKGGKVSLFLLSIAISQGYRHQFREAAAYPHFRAAIS